MALISKGNKKQYVETNQNQSAFNDVDGDINSFNLTNKGETNVTLSDMGAIKAAKGISLGAFEFGSDSLELARDSVYSNERVATDALNIGGDLGRQAMQTVGDNSSDFINEVSDTFRHFTQQTAQGVDRQLDFAKTANTSEGLQLMQGGLRYGAIALVIVGAVFVFRNGVKFS